MVLFNMPGSTRSRQTGTVEAERAPAASAERLSAAPEEATVDLNRYAGRRDTTGIGLGRRGRAPTPPPDRQSISEEAESPRKLTRERSRTQDLQNPKRSLARTNSRSANKSSLRTQSRSVSESPMPKSTPATPTGRSTLTSMKKKSSKKFVQVSFSAEDSEDRARDVTTIRAAMSHTRQALTNMKSGEDSEDKTTFKKVAQLVNKNLRKISLGKRLWQKTASDASPTETPTSAEDMASILMDSIEHAFDDRGGDLLTDLEQVMRPFQDVLRSLEMPEYSTRRGAIVNFSDHVEICEDDIKHDEKYLAMVKEISDSVQKCEASKKALLKSLEELESLKIDMLAVPTFQLRATLVGEDHRQIAQLAGQQSMLQRSSTLNKIKEDQQASLRDAAKKKKNDSDSDSDHFGSDSDEEEKKAPPIARSMPGSRRISLAVSDDLVKKAPPLRRLSTQKLELNVADLNPGESRRNSTLNNPSSRRGSFLLQTEQRSLSRRNSTRSIPPSARASGVAGNNAAGAAALNLGAMLGPLASGPSNFKTFDFSAVEASTRPCSPSDGAEGGRTTPGPRAQDDEAQAKAKKIAVALRGVRNALKDFQKENSSLKTLITSASQSPSRATSPLGVNPSPALVSPSAQQDQGNRPSVMGVQGLAKLRLKASIVGKIARWNPSATFQERITNVVEALPQDVKRTVEEEPDGVELTMLSAPVPVDPPPRGATPAPDAMIRNKDDTGVAHRRLSTDHRPSLPRPSFNGLMLGMDIKGKFSSNPLSEEPDTIAEGDGQQEKEGDLMSLLGRHSAEFNPNSLPESVVGHRRASPKSPKRLSLKAKMVGPKEQLPKWLTQDAIDTLEVRNEVHAQQRSGKWDIPGRNLRRLSAMPQQSKAPKQAEGSLLSFGDFSNSLSEVLPAESSSVKREDPILPGKRLRSLKPPGISTSQVNVAAPMLEVGTKRNNLTLQLSESLGQLEPPSPSRETLARSVSRESLAKPATKRSSMAVADWDSRLSIMITPEPVFAGAGLMQDRQSQSEMTVPERRRSTYQRLRSPSVLWRPVDGRQSDGTETDSGLQIGERVSEESSAESEKKRLSKKRRSTLDLRRQSSATRASLDTSSAPEGQEAESTMRIGMQPTADSSLDAKRGSMENKRATLEKRGSLSQLGALSRASASAAGSGHRPSLASNAMQDRSNSADQQSSRPTTAGKEESLADHGEFDRSASAGSSSATSASARSNRSVSSPRPKMIRSPTSPDASRKSSPSPLTPRGSRKSLPKRASLRHHRQPKPSSRTGFANCPAEYFASLSSKALEEDGRPLTAPQPESLKPVEAQRLPWTAPTKSIMPRLNTPQRARRRRPPDLTKLLSHVAKPMRMDVISDEFNPLAKLCRDQGTAIRGNTGGVHKTHLALMAKAGGSSAAVAALTTNPTTALASKAFSRRGQMELNMWGWEFSELDDEDVESLVPAIPRVPDLPEVDDLMVRDPLLYMVISESMNVA
mmetsp:Transcript_92192/g.176783  ORF Transcript_92192/g.176783 Transcript_92192/m.176783 type:complete len:1478 (+) Transcript_92192:235-4668(+)